jgi:uncharacterized LabA/DUF88 family protein
MDTYLFIDGAYLQWHYRKQMREFYGCVPPINYDAVLGSQQAARAYYYDAVDYLKRDNETVDECKARVANCEALHDYISSRPGFFVREGDVRRSRRRRNKDAPEQKAVDVQLAVDALEHAARGNVKLGVFLTGDLDFEPLLASLERLGVRTRLLFVPLFTSETLKRAADETRMVNLSHFHAWAANSFQQNHIPMTYSFGEPHPQAPIFVPEREGKWAGRELTLFRATNESPARLFLAPEKDELDPSYLLQYHDIAKLPVAFELTFGRIEWK